MGRKALQHLWTQRDGRTVCYRCCWIQGGLLTPPVCEGGHSFRTAEQREKLKQARAATRRL